MSAIRITVGTASVELESALDRRFVSSPGTTPHYSPRDLIHATASALLAVNTPDAVGWARELYRLTAPAPNPRQEP